MNVTTNPDFERSLLDVDHQEVPPNPRCSSDRSHEVGECSLIMEGSPGFNTQFACDVLIVFILPVPALVGTLTAFALLLGGRKR